MVFKRNKKYLLHRFLISHIFIIFLALGGKFNFDNIALIWIGTVGIPNIILLLVKNLSSIELKNNDIQMIFDKCFFKKYFESYRYDDLLFTYKEEIEGKSWGTRFRVYKKGNEKSIISIGGIVDGWDDENIKEIRSELEKRGVKVKTK